jgi:hypothetical protein
LGRNDLASAKKICDRNVKIDMSRSRIARKQKRAAACGAFHTVLKSWDGR